MIKKTIEITRTLALLVATVFSLTIVTGTGLAQSTEKAKDSLTTSKKVSTKKPKEEFLGRVIKLPRKKIAKGLGSLLIEVDLPRGYHITDKAPSRLSWLSKNSKVISFADSTFSGADKKAKFPFRLPIEAFKGKTELIFDASLFFCANDNGICLFDNIRIRMPIKITKDGSHKLSFEIVAEAPESLK